MSDERQTDTRGRSRLPRAKKRGNEDPKMIGQWKIGKTIGKGSSGRVKVARHVKTNQYAAVKIVSKNALINSRMSMSDAPAHAEKVLLGIEREIVIMKLIDHPNVLNLYDVWETGNELYLIMEYVEGGELFDYLVSRGRLPVDEALHYFQQIISAVSYCHGFNIAHRDLKPENLLLSKTGSGRNIKVADFGMAAYTDPAAMLSTSCGSPHYASPEVVEGRAYKGNISDIWSCGVILYALLAGRLPFDDENLRILLEKVKMATYEMPSEIPPIAQDLISRMLEKDVTKRITMHQILRHPFFLAATPPPSLLIDAQTPTLNQLSSSIDKPVQSEDDIDADIFDNLRTLWHGAPAAEIIESLLNDEKTWEKAVYHLLLKYRSKHLETYNMDEDEDDSYKSAARQSEMLQEPLSSNANGALKLVQGVVKVPHNEGTSELPRQNVNEDERDEPAPTYIPRPSAPTPQRAGWKGDVTLEKDPNVIMSTPYHMHTTTSPTSPPAPSRIINPDTDVFTTTPRRGQKITSPGPHPLPLPAFTLPSKVDESTKPVIKLQQASPTAHEKVSIHDEILPHVLPPSPSPSPMFELPAIDIPNLPDVDETVQRFFHQIVDRLNTMQMRQAQSSIASPSETSDTGSSIRPKPHTETNIAEQKARRGIPASPVTPVLAKETFNPDDSRFQDAAEDFGTSSPHTNDHTTLGLGISDHRAQFHPTRPAPRPPVQQQYRNSLPPLSPSRPHTNAAHGAGKRATVIEKSSRVSNKENTGVRKDEGGVRKKSSLRNAQDGRKTLGDRHVQIVLPSDEGEEVTVKKRKSILSTRSAETSPALSDGSFLLTEESSARRSWFGNLFHFKPASYNLLSVHDAYTTRDECARLLTMFGVVILANSEAGGVLKCKLDEFKDPAGVMAVSKAVRFRVELHTVTHAHSVAGYVTVLTMVQEKGALSSFKLVYNRLRREWDLDTPSTRTPSSVYGPLSTSPLFAPERFSTSYMR